MSVAVSQRTKLRGVVRSVYKQMGRAIADYHMLKDNDRILVAVSGGVDSLSLLKLFQLRQQRIPISFDIIACFVDTNFIDVDVAALENYLQSQNITYTIKSLALEAENRNCFWCSWNRRKLLFKAAGEYQCNKIALGHNLDDISETILMNLCFMAEVSASCPTVSMFEGEIEIIRPLCYVSKKEINAFAQAFVFPQMHYECAYGKRGSRQKIKQFLQKLEQDYPFVRKNIFRALRNIKQDYLL